MAYTVTNCLGILKELFFPTEPKYKELTFTQEAYAKLMCYIHLIGDYEITGFGRVVDNKIVDVKILRQTVKSATVDCDVDAMNEFLMAIPKDQIGQWILDWHSHVNMSVFASGTDSNNYEEQWKARLNKQYPLIIVNKSQQVYSRCYISPSRQTEMKIFIEQEGLTKDRLIEIYNECAADIETFCEKYEKPKTYTTHTSNGQTSMLGYSYNNKYYSGYDDYDDWDKGSNYIESTKKKEQKTQEEEEKTLVNSDSSNEYCVSCGHYLLSAEEYDRGVCDECWEMMPFEDRESYLKDLRTQWKYKY